VSVLARLRDVLLKEGEPLAAVLRPTAPEDAAPGLGRLAASGPRAAANPSEYEFLVEAIYEGYLLHYSIPRLLEDADPDFALLAGDRLYALGLERLVALGDLEAVRELADVIALCALLTARGEGVHCEALWLAGVWAVGYGSTAEHVRTKALLRDGDAAGGPALAALAAHGALAHDIVRPRSAR
jgi:hypothetical protein